MMTKTLRSRYELLLFLGLATAVAASRGASTAFAAAAGGPAPPGQAAVPRPLPGETDDAGPLLAPHAVPARAVTFKDPAIAALAGRILDGTADLRDRRDWYEIGLLYAPFDALPPAGWRPRALRDGEAISLAARMRRASRGPRSPFRGEESGAGEALPGFEGAEPLSPLATYSWSSLGPASYNVGGLDLAQGRASALWVHPSNTSFLFAGFADGGVWKTTDGGASWTPITDFEISTSIGSLDVLVRTDTIGLTDAIVYVGLGEGNTSSDAVDGGGVLRSTNGGASWVLQTLPWANPDAATSARSRHSIRRIVIDPNVPGGQSVWAAGDGGVYHTADGGASWSLVTGLPYTGKPGVGGCWPEMATDFVLDTGFSPSTLYVAFGARSNGSSVAELSCTGVANDVNVRKNNGVYRSTDGGTSWSLITGPGTGFPALPGRVGRISLLQAPSNRKQIYALISCVTNGATACPSGQFSSLGIFRTTDASAGTVIWTSGSTANFCATQGWYDLTGAVDPTNPAKLLVAGLDVYLSTDIGSSIAPKSSWTGTGASYVHADQHHIVYANASTVFVACDGGIFRGSVSGSTINWTNLNGGGLSTLQFYSLAQHPTTAGRIHGGLQDNGEAYTASGASWVMTIGGDGGFSATDPSNGEIAYEEYVYGGISRSSTGGAGSWTCIQSFGGCGGCGGCIPDGQTSFIAPLTLDAASPATLYTGSKWVYRNSAAPTGATWSQISPDLVGTTYDTILNIHSAPNGGTPGTLWVTTSNGKVWVTTDNAANWTDTTRPPLPRNHILPTRSATWVATHPADGAKAFVVFSGWNGSGGQPGHVFRTVDAGASWTDVSGALPDEPIFAVAVDPNRPNDVYIGTEYGVYVNTAGWTGTTWTKINNGQLPSVHVHQLEFSRANGKLRAATHGRGIWELTVACPAFTPPAQQAPSSSGCDALVSWTPSGSTGAVYNVYRALGSCPASGYAPAATGVSGTSVLDGPLSGGLTYSYKVTTAESAGSCESGASNCQAFTAPGGCACLQPPAFAGATTVETPFDATCTLRVRWNAGSQLCGGASPLYNVYRSSSADFIPAAANRIATCVSGTSYDDPGGLASGTTYYYAVRAEDAAAGGAGPCRGGNEDTNAVRKSGSPQGTLVPVTFFDGAEGVPQMDLGAPLWSQSTTRVRTGARSFFANGNPASRCAALTTPSLVLGPVSSPSALSFYSWRDSLEVTYDGGVVEISTDGGGNWTKLGLSPAYPGVFATGPSGSLSCSNTTQPPANVGFTGNDTSWLGAYVADLSDYADLYARIRFNFGTDPAVTSVGWYLDDIQVTNALRPSTCSAGAVTVAEVSSAESGAPLLLRRSGGSLVLRYQEIPGAGGYNVYEGSLASWYSHAASLTNTCGATSVPAAGMRETTVTPAAGSRYYLVTAYAATEGPSGYATSGEIPPADSTCPP